MADASPDFSMRIQCRAVQSIGAPWATIPGGTGGGGMKRGRGLAYGVCGMRQCVMQMESSERQGLTEGLKC